jgi:hypothetical protein
VTWVIDDKILALLAEKVLQSETTHRQMVRH